MLEKFKYKKIFLSFFVFIFMMVPTTSVLAALVPQGCAQSSGGCGFNDFLVLIRNVMNFAIFTGVAFSVLAFSWAGILYITSAGNTGQRDQAKNVFSSVTKGFLIVLLAWLIVYIVLKGLTDGSNIDLSGYINGIK